MTNIRQRIPAFIDGGESSEASFSSESELREIEFIKRIWVDKNLKRFSVSPKSTFRPEHKTKAFLMAEQNNGKYWVVGYLDDIPAYLPIWQEPNR